MKALPIVLVVAAIALAVAMFATNRPERASEIEASRLEKIEARLEALAKADATTLATLQALESRLESASGGSSRVSQNDIDMAVARALEVRGVDKFLEEAAAGDGLPKKTAGAMPASFDVRSTFELLTGQTISWDEKEKLWNRVRDAGQIAAMVEAFEERARDFPEDANVQAELGYAYIQQLQSGANQQEQGVLAFKADATFEKALKIDDHNWQARFLKATSLSFWPAVMGKQPEAIKHFEILLKQQEAQNAQPHFAETYVFLGNIYSQQGKMEKAQELWNKGLALFPNHAGLKKQIAIVESK